MERRKQTRSPWETGVLVQSPPPHNEQTLASQRHLEDGTPEPLGHPGLVQEGYGASKTCSGRNAVMSWLPKVSTVPTSGQSNCMLALTPGRTGWGDSSGLCWCISAPKGARGLGPGTHWAYLLGFTDHMEAGKRHTLAGGQCRVILCCNGKGL